MNVMINTSIDQLLEDDEAFTVGIDSTTPAMSTTGSPSTLELTIQDGDGEFFASLDVLDQ